MRLVLKAEGILFTHLSEVQDNRAWRWIRKLVTQVDIRFCRGVKLSHSTFPTSQFIFTQLFGLDHENETGLCFGFKRLSAHHNDIISENLDLLRES